MTEPDLRIVMFYRPVAWWGWLIAYYQLLRGVKYWQVTHVELLTVEGLYAYRIDKTITGSCEEFVFEPDYKVALLDDYAKGPKNRQIVSSYLHRTWGDFSPLSPFNSNHCVRYVIHLLGLGRSVRPNMLPGQLMRTLEVRNVYGNLHGTYPRE